MQEWFAWLAEKTIPLDKYMITLEAAKLYEERKSCLKLALYKLVKAAMHGMMISDNNLFNFGVINNTVVIIDAGSRRLQSTAILKGTLNDKSIRRWWSKLGPQCRPDELEEIQEIWTNAWNLTDASEKLKRTLQPLRLLQQPVEVTHMLDVWSLIAPATNTDSDPQEDETAEASDALEWLCSNCFHKKLAQCKLLVTGKLSSLCQYEEKQLPHIRLQTVLMITQEKRKPWIQNLEDVLPGEKVGQIISAWRDDYQSCMHADNQEQLRLLTDQQERHHKLRGRFRTFLFQMCGCYDLIIFFLHVKPSWCSLAIFHEIYTKEMQYKGFERINMAVRKIKNFAPQDL